ncbi:uncharacterized protein PG998_009232 [Apiospora kogelbergensis]|uniref:Uncharacterized protein n=1 Tax=Apiospora kogelbergensis TaxID=1337665 RepID=A0AAW0R729_9PEZI
MAQDQVDFNITWVFTQGYLKDELLRKYLVNEAHLKPAHFVIKKTAGRLELKLKSDDPLFEEKHRNKIETRFNEAELERKKRRMEDAAKGD